jgi:hypothetical protein
MSKLIAFLVIAIAIGVATTGIAIQSASAVGSCQTCGEDGEDGLPGSHRSDAKHKAAESLRHTAEKIKVDPHISDPPKSEIVSKLNDRANQLDPSDGDSNGGGGTGGDCDRIGAC